MLTCDVCLGEFAEKNETNDAHGTDNEADAEDARQEQLL